ncbi:bifunctional diguanylate cyclase/phosphodiesterase [Roseixanthobacter pseudopolyaromaticivorans]|uniref:bifunctional diguanylate cyclase/phosphodiesterase n=1 Tax=Xanthobacteraceae TaxID=335928 RepID=UPI0037297F68
MEATARLTEAAKPDGTFDRVRSWDAARWAVGLGGAFIITVLVATIVLTIFLRDRALSDRHRELENLALTLAEQTDRAFQGAEQIQRSLIERLNVLGATDPESLVRAASTYEMHEIITQRVHALPQIDAITIIGTKGKLLNFSRYWPIPDVNVSDRDYFSALSTGASETQFVSAPVINRGTGTPTIYLAHRFSAPDGSFLGLVLAAMRRNYFEKFYGGIDLGPGGFIALCRQDGVVLASYPPVAENINHTAQRALMRHLFAAANAAGLQERLIPPGLVDRQERLAAFQSLAHFPLSIMVSDTSEDVSRSLRTQILPMLVASGLICLAITVAVIMAVRQLRAQQEFAQNAYRSARQDELTALPNRLHFLEQLDALLNDEMDTHGFALLFLDLDYFKSVNDTLGHAIGDDLLRAVARRMEDYLAPGDMLARIGGDEFGILQRGGGATEALSLAGQIINAIREPFTLNHHRVIAGGSIGIALAPQDARLGVELLKNADLALYRAKNDGRGLSRLFERQMEHAAVARRTLELDLDEAWRQQQFFLCYQPIFASQSGALAGFEALLRWRHPSRGIVAPATFIPAAEDTGLIVPIGAWVLEQACLTAATWPAPLTVSVNLSPIQFRTGEVEAQVNGALRRSGLAPRRLELELTETTLLREGASVREILQNFRTRGILIAIDDFGTGYSSLGYLRTLPIDRIKIDRAFVTGLGQDTHSLPIIRAMQGLADAISVSTTVEGVERAEQLEILRAERCTYVQGYFLGHPGTAEDALRMAKEAKV